MTSSSVSILRSLLRDPDYVRIWIVGACAGTARWLEMLVVGVFAFEITGSPFLVALLVVARLVPLTLIGPLVGTIADRVAPRRILLVGQVLATAVALTVFALFASGLRDYWIVLAACFASGVVWTTDMPVRRRIAGDIAGRDRLVPALSFDSATNHGTRMVGPFLGGFIYEALGPTGGYMLTSALAAIALAMVIGLRSGGAVARQSGPVPNVLRELGEGLAYAMRDHDLSRILLVTIVFNIWGLPFLAMIPVIGADVLHLSPGGVGVLAALEGAGAFAGALLVATAFFPINHRRLYFFGALLYVVLACLAGFVASAVAMAFILFAIGLGLSGFSSMQSALIYSTAPPHLRGRIFGLLAVSIGSGLLGVFNMGIMGEWLGGAGAVSLVAAEGIAILALIGLFWRQLRRANP